MTISQIEVAGKPDGNELLNLVLDEGMELIQLMLTLGEENERN